MSYEQTDGGLWVPVEAPPTPAEGWTMWLETDAPDGRQTWASMDGALWTLVHVADPAP